MFAILFTSAMDPFYEVALSFPTVIFSVLLFISFLFGLIAIFGVIDLDFFDIADFDVGDGGAHGVSGIFMRLGIGGLPLPLLLFAVSLIGWLVSFNIFYVLSDWIPSVGFFRVIVGLVVFFVALFIAAYISGKALAPFKGIFLPGRASTKEDIVGSVGVVRSTTVTQEFGEVRIASDAGEFVVDARSYEHEFVLGDRVAIIEYLPEKDIYKVISELDFKNS
ncbi:MAG: hypothetical protein COA42_11345 [Alteromonadaceae bacterium]|nr:MAG: hypothetical protein COA42_11345 [Alteromonadaceae bacterium]